MGHKNGVMPSSWFWYPALSWSSTSPHTQQQRNVDFALQSKNTKQTENESWGSRRGGNALHSWTCSALPVICTASLFHKFSCLVVTIFWPFLAHKTRNLNNVRQGVKHQDEILDKSLHYCREKSLWGYKYGSGHMKEVNIPVQKNTFPSSGEKARWWLEGCGQGRWKVVDSGLPFSTRQGAAAQESWSGIGPSGRREGVGGKLGRKSRGIRVSPKKYLSDKKNWCAGPGYAQIQSYVFNFWQIRPLLWAWYCKHRFLKKD